MELAPGIPKESLWAYDQGGINQVGCIYTAQGFEFDYEGVIFGNDWSTMPIWQHGKQIRPLQQTLLCAGRPMLF
ncbi:MAG: DUF2075 domain-containing protein [Acidobacteriia bacterium]|nr:DUF2075 domain-containing protein [Terriglobia bacterium]